MRTKDETKEKKIQDATAAIILEEGAAAVSTTKVAKRVGISQSNVYLYFKNKDELLVSVYQREVAKIQAAGDLDQLLAPDVPLTQRLREYVQGVYLFALAHPDSLTLIQQIKWLMGQVDGDPFAIMAQPNNVVRRLMQAAIDAGVIRAVPVNVHMAMVFAVIQTHTQNIKHGRYAADAYPFEALYQLIWAGMKS